MYPDLSPSRKKEDLDPGDRIYNFADDLNFAIAIGIAIEMSIVFDSDSDDR
nr:hypothetical protein [uncultured Desulfobacter sp.]